MQTEHFVICCKDMDGYDVNLASKDARLFLYTNEKDAQDQLTTIRYVYERKLASPKFIETRGLFTKKKELNPNYDIRLDEPIYKSDCIRLLNTLKCKKMSLCMGQTREIDVCL